MIISYLSDRVAVTKADGVGRQGSSLGPILWNILFEDLLRLNQVKDLV